MHQTKKFWIFLAIFQTAFGFAVFEFTRQFYIGDSVGGRQKAVTNSGRTQKWNDIFQQDSLSILEPLVSASASTTQDPAEMYRLANVYFEEKRYGEAAELYDRLLLLNPGSADVHNNLGITLHYLGRSARALQILDEGVAVEPSNQRIWLTLGFVHKSLGNFDDARTALSKAVQMNPDNDVGKSAASMLEEVP